MKKVFIGLLILAAGAATFFLLQKKDKPNTGNNIQKEWIVGKWKLDSIILPKDSTGNFMAGIMGIIAPDLVKYRYEFKKDGAISFSSGDSLTKGSSRYEWMKENQLVWKEYPADTSDNIFNISTLTRDSLVLQSQDSAATLLFTKAKK